MKTDAGPTVVFDKGNVALSVSTLDRIGEAVAKALLKRDELINRFLYIHSAAVTQSQLLQYMRQMAPGREFATVTVDTSEMERQALEKLRKGKTGPDVMPALMARVSFGLGLGLFETTDNALLSLEEVNEDDAKAFLAEYDKS